MNIQTTLIFINLLCAGILAGMEMMAHYGIHGTSDELDERAQLQLRQALVLRLRMLVPAIFVPTLLTAIAMVILQGSAPGLALRILGSLGLLVWIGLRVAGTVPINSATLEWKLDAPPQDWKARVMRAERFHDVGVWGAVITFASFLLAYMVNPI